MKLATIGYEGMEQGGFWAILANAGVETLVDVRELPLSRKKGFSKKALEYSAAQVGVGYVHLRALGSPREVRHVYHADGDWQKFSREYRSYLNTEGMEELGRLARLVSETYCCLLCFEADPLVCHRSLLVNRLRLEVEGEVTVSHLGKEEKAIPAWRAPWVGIPARL